MMDFHIGEYGLTAILVVILLWKPVHNGLIRELNIRGVIAKFRDRDRPPPP